MFNQEYFKKLASMIKLTEAGEEVPPTPAEESVPIQSGNGMEEAPVEGEQDPNAMEQDPAEVAEDPNAMDGAPEEMSGLDDASYMNGNQQPPNPIDDATKREQKGKLFDEFTELKELAIFIKTSFEEKLSFDLVDETQSKAINLLFEKVKDIVKKIIDYQLTTFIDRSYEESLYIYMLLRSELVTSLKYVRQVMNMSSNKKDQTQDKN